MTAASQTVLKLLPPGITPPYVLSYNAATVPILQLALSSKKLPQMQLFDLGQNFIRPQLSTVAGAAIPSPYGGKILQVQVDLDQEAMQAHNVSADDVVNTITVQNLILPAGDQKLGKFDWNVALNASPVALEKINDLPVKKVNGTIIYMHDVAYVHAGSPPQTNLVRVNGSRAVLMTILKAGAASTLSVIEGIKSLLPRVEESLPSSLNLHAVGDQSVFVKSAVVGVIREAALAAALVGVMILLFLGSWRSTVIILIEIPLAILFSLTALSWLGETVNVMTLGGLALAVGILVDDGTVTIENINYHLELGKEIETVHPGRGTADRHSRIRDAVMPVHRVRADVPARRRRRLSVPTARRGRRLCPRRFIPAVAHPCPNNGQLSDARPSRQPRTCAERCRAGVAAIAQSASALSADASIAASRKCANATGRCCYSRSAHLEYSSPASSGASWFPSRSGRSLARTSSRPSIPARS